jgi:hypothetical protein
MSVYAAGAEMVQLDLLEPRRGPASRGPAGNPRDHRREDLPDDEVALPGRAGLAY